MDTHLLLLLHLLHHLLLFFQIAAGPVSTEFIQPNFTASHLLYVDTSGVFLTSRNLSFHAAVLNPGKQQSSFYLSVVHADTGTVVWSANRDTPVPNSGLVSLDSFGLSVSLPGGSVVWSTPYLTAPVTALLLLDSGNLQLLDATNATLWQSFDHPTDTILPGQPLPVGASLVSSVSDFDLSHGAYSLAVTAGDALLRWQDGFQQYWSFSNDPRSTKDFNAQVSYMALNNSGLFLFSSGSNPKTVFEVDLPPAVLLIAKLDPSGRFRIMSYSGGGGAAVTSSSSQVNDVFVAPSNDCDLPFLCKALGLCNPGSKGSTCICPAGFDASPPPGGGCSPSGGSALSSNATCGGIGHVGGGSLPSYLSLGSGIGYIGNKFATPIISGVDFSACESLCSANCSCLGFFYKNSSGSCYLLQHQLGSIFSSNSGDGNIIGYIKTVGTSGSSPDSNSSSSTNVIAIVLPSISAFLLVVVLLFVGSAWWRRRRKRGVQRHKSTAAVKDIYLGRQKSWPAISADADDDDPASDEDEIAIPGLPSRFTYADLEAATQGFRTRIGSGGFGEVFKGILPDKSPVAVKRMIGGIGVQGKKEFCTEIAIIGSIHHVNLVRLRGFCAQGRRRLLVYEFMNRGSLEKSLFNPRAPVLEWHERIQIAIGAARGLAYLHSGCEHKIIHCDVKPENILLHDGGVVKISDFGLAKLLSPEQSGFFTTMRGTRGYLAPEWLTNSAISDRTDVYSYGMVLLEIVRGRKNGFVGTSSDGGGSGWSGSSSSGGRAAGSGYFPMVALENHEQRSYIELADPRLEGRVEEREVTRAVKVALCCLHEDPGLRPSMATVVGMLEGTLPVWEPRVEALGFLKLYGRGFVDPAVGRGRVGMLYGGNYTMTSVMTTASATTTASSPSYISSHQVSGPR